MASEQMLATAPIVDVDSHVIEPRDLWTSRMSARHKDVVPTVVWDADAGEHRWKVGDALLGSETEYASAGWNEPFPAHPPTLEAAHPGGFDPVARLAHLDACGVYAQVLYPNLLGFDSSTFLGELGPDLATEAVRAYNDFLFEFASTDRRRLIPIAMIPYWDIDTAVAEVRRIKELGFPGVLLAALLSRFGLPNLSDPAWDPLLTEIQDLDLSINLHIGFNPRPVEQTKKSYERRTKAALAAHTNRLAFVRTLATVNFSVIEATADLILRGTFQRFPRLKVVSVESGFGYVPYLLDNMDWHWRTSAAIDEYRDRPLPSEIWRQHFFATFWFERASLALLPDFQDNVLFETDFPHETGIFPGHWDHNRTARDLVKDHLADIDTIVVRKVLGDNAARLYDVELPAPALADA